MSDERTEPAQSDDAGEEPTAASNDRLVARPRAALSGKSVGWWFVWIVLVVVVVAVGRFVYMMQITLYPDSGPDGVEVRRVADTATKHLSNNPNVVSTTITEARASTGTELNVRLKDDTSPDTVTNLLTSTHQAAFDKNDPDTHITLNIVLIWTLHGTDVKFLSSSPPPPDRSIIKRDLAAAGEAITIEDTYIDYGQVTALPSTLAQPGAPDSSKTFTMNGWKVTSTSNSEGQFPTTVSFEQVIAAARQASPAGTIDLNGTTLSVTGLATDERKGLTPEAAAPVIHSVNNCRTAGLTTLQLNDGAKKEPSSDDLWLTFTCNNGTWTPHDDGSTGQDEATILNKAAEL